MRRGKAGPAARRPVWRLRVSWMYNKVADPGDVVIQKRGVSIFNTHELVNAMHLYPFSWQEANVSSSRRNQICLVGCHQGVVGRFVSPGIYHTKVSKQSLRDIAY